MKELSIEEKAKAYDEVIDKVAHFIKKHVGLGCMIHPNSSEAKELFNIFPILKESEDERIIESLLEYLHTLPNHYAHSGVCAPEWIAWLEKQEEKNLAFDFKAKNWYVSKVDGKIHDMTYNPSDEIEQKFKVGDWVVCEVTGSVYQIKNCIEILRNHEYWYGLTNGDYIGSDEVIHYHLWTLEDAKDGDVLYFSDETIVIFKDLYNATTFHSYCHIEDGLFDVSKDEMPDWWEGKGFRPATKEQCDLLFQKMKEAGYEWDAKKKELKKIEQTTWSEEDEHWRQKAIDFMKHPDLIKATPTLVKHTIDWLKSLRPQNAEK